MSSPTLATGTHAFLNHDVYVVDASVAIKLVVKEPLAVNAEALFRRLAEPKPATLHVPDLFYIECANILWKYVRRHGHDRSVARQSLGYLVALGLKVTPTHELAAAALELAVDEGITAYDACYLALAASLGCSLITADERLVRQLQPGHPKVAWLGDYPAVTRPAADQPA